MTAETFLNQDHAAAIVDPVAGQQCHGNEQYADRQCTEIHAYKFVDKNNPRVEITITEIEL